MANQVFRKETREKLVFDWLSLLVRETIGEDCVESEECSKRGNKTAEADIPPGQGCVSSVEKGVVLHGTWIRSSL